MLLMVWQPKTQGWGRVQQHYSRALTQNKACPCLADFTPPLPSFLGSPFHPGINQSPSGHFVGFSDEDARPPPPDWPKCPGPLPISTGKGLEEKMICHPESDNSAGLKSCFPEPKGTRVEAKVARKEEENFGHPRRYLPAVSSKKKYSLSSSISSIWS